MLKKLKYGFNPAFWKRVARMLLRRFTIWRYRHISEQQFILILSVLVGVLAGISSVILKNFTHAIQNFVQNVLINEYGFEAYYFVFPFIGIYITYLIIRYVVRKNPGHGIPNAIHALSKEKAVMRSRSMWQALVTAPFTVGFGGSVGLEGPAVGTGAGIGSNVGRSLHLNAKWRSLLLGCGTAAALSAVFKVPMTGIVFVIEVFKINLSMSSLIPLLLSSATGMLVSHFFLGQALTLQVDFVNQFKLHDVPYYALMAALAGIVSVHFTGIYSRLGRFFENRFKRKLPRLVVGSILLGALIFIMPSLYGEGYATINSLLAGNYHQASHLIWVSEWFGEEAAANIWIIICILVGMLYLKMIATTMTFAAGGIGGTFAPTLFIGAVFGAMFALIVNAVVPSAALSVGNFSHVGITGVMAGVMHAPLTAIFLTMESTGGYTLIVPLMIVAAISFTISSLMSRRSIFSDDLKKTGDVVTHDKDKMILQYIELDKVIETNFIPLDVEMTLGQIVRNAVAKSTRNLFPVLSKSGRLLGVITLDEIRGIMFDHALYDKVTAESLMQVPLTFIDYRVDSMEEIMKKFQDSGMWNLPVVESEQMYYKGFVSKSKLLSVYRRMMINYNSEDM